MRDRAGLAPGGRGCGRAEEAGGGQGSPPPAPPATLVTRVAGEKGDEVSTARIWSYSEPPLATDLRGFDVEALDGRIGTVDEATDEGRGGYVVVDSGPWIFRKKVMLPAGVIDRVDREARTVHVNRTKQEIKNAPDLGDTGYDDDAYRVALGRYYGSGGAGFRAPAPGDSERGRL